MAIINKTLYEKYSLNISFEIGRKCFSKNFKLVDCCPKLSSLPYTSRLIYLLTDLETNKLYTLFFIICQCLFSAFANHKGTVNVSLGKLLIIKASFFELRRTGRLPIILPILLMVIKNSSRFLHYSSLFYYLLQTDLYAILWLYGYSSTAIRFQNI